MVMTRKVLVFVPKHSSSLLPKSESIVPGILLYVAHYARLAGHRLGLGKLNVKTVRGPALRPRFFRNVPKYDESVSSKSLADPCARSCQLLIPQLGGFGKSPQKWDWEVSYGIAALQKEIPQGPASWTSVNK